MKVLPSAGVGMHAVEHAPAFEVAVHVQVEEVAQITPALRDAERERVARFYRSDRRVRRVAKERHEIAHGGKTDAGDTWVGRLVPELVDRQRRRCRAFRQKAYAARID